MKSNITQTTAIGTVAKSLPPNKVILLTHLISNSYIPYTDLHKFPGKAGSLFEFKCFVIFEVPFYAALVRHGNGSERCGFPVSPIDGNHKISNSFYVGARLEVSEIFTEKSHFYCYVVS